MKKFLSLLLGGVLSISSMVSAGTSVIAADTDETGGFTLEEVEASEIKPVLSVSVDDVKGGKVFDLADAAGKKVHVKLDVKGADKKYCSTQIWFFYDASLKIEKNQFGELDIEKGNALKGLSGSFPEAVDAKEADGRAMNGLFLSSMGKGDYGLDGTMWEFDLVVPADAKAGDIFPIDIRYNYGRGYGLFINNISDKKGELMSAYAFTKGIYNKTYNNNFTASASSLSIYLISISCFIAPSLSNLANSLARSLFSPIIILEGYKLSYNACPSLKNSGENIILSILYFSFIDFINPTGIVDFITIVVSIFISLTFFITSSTLDVSKKFFSSS